MTILRLHNPGSAPDALTVRALLNAFLASPRRWCARHRQEREHTYNVFCQTFGDSDPLALCADDLEDWLAQQTTLHSDWTRKNWCAGILAAFNWAAKRKRLIAYNPLLGVKVRPGKRGRPITDLEFRALLRHATDSRFRRLVLFLRYTGARPGEAAAATWKDFKPDRRALVLDAHKTEHITHEARVIYLPPQAVRLLALIARTDKHEHIFVNAWGKPWGRSALSQRMATIRSRAGIPRDAKLYGNRHRYATDAILSGVDIATLAELLGHKGTRTTSAYIHLAGKDQHLLAAIEKIKH